MTDTLDRPTETHAFQAEVSRLLHLMVHSVYSNRDIFLRELISNAADACEKLRYLALETPALLGDDGNLAITLAADPAAKTLTVADNGIGMTRDELIENLGTIAKSGTKAFLKAVGEGAKSSNLIGQFGVGFYSAFMVASRVVVTSRRAGSDQAWTWISDGINGYDIRPAEGDEAPARGTVIRLELNDESTTYADEATVERIVETYSAHVPVPVTFVKAGEDAKALSDGSALWAKPKSEITKEAYKEFYGNVSGQWDEPAMTIHYKAEGRHEYSVLLFVPSMKPFDLFDPARKGHLKLYVRRVFIADDVDLLPHWLRFARGVVDSEDLPLNLSREMLQHNPVLEAIRKNVTSRLLSELAKLAESDAAKFAEIWEAFGPVLKEGLYEDAERRDELFKIVRFRTTASGEATRTLADYVAGLKENQTKIYYLLADDPARAAASPHLEGFAGRGVEVLLLTDPVDAFWVRTALGFEGKPFQSVTQGASDLDAIPLVDAAEPTPDAETATGTVALVARLKELLGDKVSDVRTSNRLASSPSCLVAPEYGPDKQFEKIMARHQGAAPFGKPVLEINPRHPLILAVVAKLGGDESLVEDAAVLLLGQARVADGEAPDDPADFGRRLAHVLEKALGA
ncbi:molecular chaperone HtpG [Siculibacillus lacustris]|uniref:Chaperone protein HtpG n=1 Tax=Siculibacillus lacustris TaxID=1549641 RepID=A0A4Q9VK98_9HYPH|nr:molecular chaperone HtpG [Siculibacillus lacustris]TBW35814.1 molecular chaperone HtpG [Siculibacillus lacustris]